VRYASSDDYLQVEAEDIEEVCERTSEVEALMRSVSATFDNYVRLNKKIPPEMVTSIASVDDPAYLADKLLSHLGIKLEDKQSLLECTNPAERLERILGYMRSELEILKVEKRIRSRVKNQIEMTQKKYYLNEQMRAIQKELGEKDEFKNEIQELEDKLRHKKMPAESREKGMGFPPGVCSPRLRSSRGGSALIASRPTPHHGGRAAYNRVSENDTANADASSTALTSSRKVSSAMRPMTGGRAERNIAAIASSASCG
jgi:hypothetical protein